MITRHSKLGMFFFDNEIDQFLLAWELVAQAQTIVVNSKANVHISVGLWLPEFYQQFVVVIANVFYFSPYRLPYFVERGGRGLYDLKTIHKIGLPIQFQS